jgi:hypothetical protein
MQSVPNWISYLHANSKIFIPFLAILINFLKSKIDLDSPKFWFKIHFEYEEVHMEKVVPFFKSFKIIFYFEFLEYGKATFDPIKSKSVWKFVLNQNCHYKFGLGPLLSFSPGPLPFLPGLDHGHVPHRPPTIASPPYLPDRRPPLSGPAAAGAESLPSLKRTRHRTPFLSSTWGHESDTLKVHLGP